MKFKEVAHLYIGCKIKKLKPTWIDEKTLEFSLLGITHSQQNLFTTVFIHFLQNEGQLMSQTGLNDNYKPILRKLSDMNVIEMMEFVNLIPFYKQSHVFDFDIKVGAINFKVSYHGQFNSYRKRVAYAYNNPEQVVYLLSKHFDLFGLIESDEAIDAATINPNPYL